jgi:DNA-binding response OmpR family regulator
MAMPLLSEAASPARVLVVEDDPGVAELIASVLVSNGHTVTAAPTAEAALELLRADCFEIVVTDLELPRIDGLNFAATAKSSSPHLAVIVLSGGWDAAEVCAVNENVDFFLQKPFAPSELAEAVERLGSR